MNLYPFKLELEIERDTERARERERETERQRGRERQRERERERQRQRQTQRQRERERERHRERERQSDKKQNKGERNGRDNLFVTSRRGSKASFSRSSKGRSSPSAACGLRRPCPAARSAGPTRAAACTGTSTPACRRTSPTEGLHWRNMFGIACCYCYPSIWGYGFKLCSSRALVSDRGLLASC